MPTRITGMSSGLDTESIIQELVKAKSTKVTTLKKNNTRLEWKQDAWKDLNKELKSLQSKFGSLRFTSDLKKKTSSVSNPNAVKVITGSGAMNSVQSLSIKQLAKSGYLTGQKVASEDGASVTKETTLSSLTLKDADGNPVSGLTDTNGGSFTVTTGGKSTTISIGEDTKISDIVSQLNKAGVSANFDEKNQRFYIGASGSGKANDFAITADNAAGFSALSVLGINVDPANAQNKATADEYKKYTDYYSALKDQDKDAAISAITEDVDSEIYKMLKAEASDKENPDFSEAYDKLMAKMEAAEMATNASGSSLYSKGAVKLAGEDALIELNGAEYTSATNSVEVNGLTFECFAVADDITVTTKDDTDGIYDQVKGLLKQYNEVINKIDKLYNAGTAKGYDPLTDEEKDALTDSEVEKIENKVKESLLRKDTTLQNIFSSLKETMASGYEVGGKTMYLSDFGIGTLSYFEAADFEHSAYHIDGDKDDEKTSGNADKLKSMIATDPDAVVGFFSKLFDSVYSKMNDLSKSTTNSSFGSFYDDKSMKKELTDFTSQISKAEAKLNEYEDKYYAKFAKMESALSAMESKNSYLSGLFGQ
ncbi:MAG: flagellar filament capping protein FliD [Lachnospiraceae bacterium]|nr:flagellar filament capping protein FliD [Lachnospiraceae bacterium]